MKCGFPIKSADKYLNILKNLNYEIEIVPTDEHCSPTTVHSYIKTQNLYRIIHDFLDIHINDLSIAQAFDLLNDLQNQLKQIEMEEKNNEKEK